MPWVNEKVPFYGIWVHVFQAASQSDNNVCLEVAPRLRGKNLSC